MKKILLILFTFFLFSNFLKADYLLGHLERCASEYYYARDNAGNYRLYYFNLHTNRWNSTRANVGFIENGYVYDSTTGRCKPSELTNILGIKEEDYNFLIALTAILLGFTTVFFMSYIAIGVARR